MTTDNSDLVRRYGDAIGLAEALLDGRVRARGMATERAAIVAVDSSVLVTARFILEAKLRLRFDAMLARGTLRRFLAAAYQHRPGGVVLASGQVSDEYLDCRAALSQPDALRACGVALLDTLLPEVGAVGGLTLGADPLAFAVAAACAGTDRVVRWFVVRKAPKARGLGRRIEGDLVPGRAVAVLDDVATTGASTCTAIEACREAGLAVAQVVVLVDREAGGLDAIRAAAGPGVPVEALFTLTEVRAAWREWQELQRALAGDP